MAIRLLVVLFSLAAGGCVDQRPSSGHCSGTPGGVSVDADIDPDASEMHRDDDILGDEDAFVNMRYGSDAVLVAAVWDDMPVSADVGEHPLPLAGTLSDETVRTFDLSLDPAPEPVVVSGTITLDNSGRERLSGSFTVVWEDDSELTCDFDLRRAYELDTDD